ncbi:MAG TPA: hypothetical protein VGN42_14090 [Pirellulales bacterium]|jgi:hypothetical protein|nr:hypothetical protein [Pirellulales bacterium]
MIGAACVLTGFMGGWLRAAATSYSPTAYSEQVTLAGNLKQAISSLEAENSRLIAKHKELEQSALKARLARETSERDVAMVRKAMASIEGGKGIPDWASEEKWATANAEIARLKVENEKNQKLLSANESKIDSLRKLAERQTERAMRAQRESKGDSGPSKTAKGLVFTGSGSKSTQTFATKSRSWKLSWECEDSVSIWITEENGDTVEIVNSQTKKDSSIVRCPPGRYFIKVIGLGDWRVMVNE